MGCIHLTETGVSIREIGRYHRNFLKE